MILIKNFQTPCFLSGKDPDEIVVTEIIQIFMKDKSEALVIR